MLEGTKAEIQNLLVKLQGFDVLLDTLNRMHKDYMPQIDERVKQISEAKLKRIDEVYRLLS